MSDFLLRNIAFSDEYAKAVEQKQIAEQQALQANWSSSRRKQEAEQARQVAQGQADAAVIAAKGAADARLLQAEAEAQANQLLAQSLTPQLLQYQYILKLAPGVQTIFIPSGNQFILPLAERDRAVGRPAGGALRCAGCRMEHMNERSHPVAARFDLTSLAACAG